MTPARFQEYVQAMRQVLCTQLVVKDAEGELSIVLHPGFAVGTPEPPPMTREQRQAAEDALLYASSEGFPVGTESHDDDR